MKAEEARELTQSVVNRKVDRFMRIAHRKIKKKGKKSHREVLIELYRESHILFIGHYIYRLREEGYQVTKNISVRMQHSPSDIKITW